MRLWQPQVWLYIPLYLALCIALGAACRALAHFITNPGVTLNLWLTLLINCCVSFGVHCGGERLKRWSHRLRIVLFLAIPLGALLLGTALLVPRDAETEINAGVALVIGWSALLCVLLIGSHYGRRRLPFAAPLVPALSLFGLLNSLSVDTLIQICFLIFVAASLYIIVYEPMLHRLEARYREESIANSGQATAPPPSRGRRGSSPWSRLPAFLSRPEVARTAVGYLAACSMWFAAFLGGATLFYYPVAAVLPRVLAAPFGAVHGSAAALLDWRGSSSTMELRGGNYPLSDRVVMQVALTQSSGGIGSTPVLWRGRIFEHYDASRWAEDDRKPAPALASYRIRNGGLVAIPPQPAAPSGHPILDQAKNRRATFSPRLVRTSLIEAYVEPVRPASPRLYFPGELVAVQSVMPTLQSYSNGSYTTGGIWQNTAPYALRAVVKEERLSGLIQAPGLSPAVLQAWKQDATLAPTLALSPELRGQLAPIVAEIKATMSARKMRNPDAPYAKANAIRDYLAKTCTYSLSSPLVPATEDAVIFFMTKSHRGACDMFASSMALLLRAMDVPARLASGYIAPEELTEGQVTTGGSTLASEFSGRGTLTKVAGGNASLSFTLREKDAHAWVEYFIPGAGWLTYDPTAGTRTTEMPIDEQIASLFKLPGLQLNQSTFWLPLCGLLLIGAGLGWAYFDAQGRRTIVPQTPTDITRAQITAAYEQALRLLHRRVPYAAHFTPREYESAVNHALLPPAAKQEFAALTYLLIVARYTKQPPALGRDELQTCLSRLRRALRH